MGYLQFWALLLHQFLYTERNQTGCHRPPGTCNKMRHSETRLDTPTTLEQSVVLSTDGSNVDMYFQLLNLSTLPLFFIFSSLPSSLPPSLSLPSSSLPPSLPSLLFSLPSFSLSLPTFTSSGTHFNRCMSTVSHCILTV